MHHRVAESTRLLQEHLPQKLQWTAGEVLGCSVGIVSSVFSASTENGFGTQGEAISSAVHRELAQLTDSGTSRVAAALA